MKPLGTVGYFAPLVCALLVFCSFHAAPGVLRAGDSLVDRGRRMMKAGKYSKAVAFFKAAIIRDVTDESAWEGYRMSVIAEAGAGARGSRVGRDRRKPAEAPKVSSPVISLAPLARNGAATVGEAAPANETSDVSSKAGSSSGQGLSSMDLGGMQLDTKPLTPTGGKSDLLSLSAMTSPKVPATVRRGGAKGTTIFDSVDSRNLAPWTGLEVFEEVPPILLHDPDMAKRRFFEERKKYRNSVVNQFAGGVEVIATYFPVRLYKFLAVMAGARRGWSFKETDKNFVLMSRYARRFHEFSVDLRERTTPRKYPFINNVVENTWLEDDNGHRYSVVKSMGPSQKRLMKADTYSVCFPLKDKDGKPIFEKAKKRFFLCVKGLDNTRDVKRIPFDKKIFKR